MTETAERNGLIENNLGLVHSCANKFRGRGIEYDDLYSAGCVGLIKAADGFDKTLGFAFSTYAVPAILGEIRRLFRDGGSVKVGRTAKEKARELMIIKEKMEEELDREPTVSEVAERAGMEPCEVSELIYAIMPPISLTVDSDENVRQIDIPVSSCEQPLIDKLSLDSAIKKLCEKDRLLIKYRYFDGLTQTVTAKKMGMTQVQVSRREKAILKTLRENMI